MSNDDNCTVIINKQQIDNVPIEYKVDPSGYIHGNMKLPAATEMGRRPNIDLVLSDGRTVKVVPQREQDPESNELPFASTFPVPEAD